MNRAFRKWGEPRLKMRRDLESNVPDWKGRASMPAKASGDCFMFRLQASRIKNGFNRRPPLPAAIQLAL